VVPAAAQEFVWPVSGWITANDRYFWGDSHGGSVDIAAPYWTAVTAARDGTVLAVDTGDCNSVLLDHGGGWTTYYCHLIRDPLVDVGQTVRGGQLLGFVGRYGSANIPHLHFTIRKSGARKVIPGLGYGTWARRNTEIPGTYPGVVGRAPMPFTFGVRTVVPNVSLRNAPSDSALAIGTLPVGTIVRIADTKDGFYYGEEPYEGWIPMSAVDPIAGSMIDLMVGVAGAPTRVSPSAGAAAIYTYSAGYLLPAISARPGWYEVFCSYPTRYGWIASSAVQRTTSQRVAMVAASAAVRSGPGAGYPLLGTLTMGTYYNFRTVYENHNGWLRIDYNGRTGWLQGWRTTGRR